MSLSEEGFIYNVGFLFQQPVAMREDERQIVKIWINWNYKIWPIYI